jgi:uncharacterized Fe-S radical SAM superfamily protein PflX
MPLYLLCELFMSHSHHEAMLYNRQDEGKVKCALCSRRCLISDGAPGFCLVRRNEGGNLYTLNYGKTTSMGVDPIGKKPLSHFNPGSLVLSFAAEGCNFRCQFCDNWMISQDTEAQRLRGKKAFEELRKLLTKEDLETIRESSKEFRENFKLR